MNIFDKAFGGILKVISQVEESGRLLRPKNTAENVDLTTAVIASGRVSAGGVLRGHRPSFHGGRVSL